MSGLKDSTAMTPPPQQATDDSKNDSPRPKTVREMINAPEPRQDEHYVGSSVVDIIGDVQAFHRKFGLEYKGEPRCLTGELGRFRVNFLEEELNEYKESHWDLEQFINQNAPKDDAYVTEQLALQLDALLDLVYVTIGAALLQFREPLVREAWRRIQEANMAKVRANADGSNSKRNTMYDVIKPIGWEAPDHSDLVEDHAHRSE